MTTQNIPPIPGLEVVGRGLNLRPHQTYELKQVLFDRHNDRTYSSKETGLTYLVPEGYEVNESPPMPTNQASGKVVIAESWEHFDNLLSVDTELAASNNLFSVDVNMGQSRQLRAEEESYYAVRTSFTPFWTLYLSDITTLKKDLEIGDIPTPFDYNHRKIYEKFFEQYGTHYIKRAWVGGKAMLTFTVAKSVAMTKQDIRTGINASLSGLANASHKTSLKQHQEQLKSNSECTVLGQGGDQAKLSMLNSLDKANYDNWLTTITNNPQVIEFEAAGVWTLIDDENIAQALSAAYKAATTFTPISAIVSYDNSVYFIRGKKYTRYSISEGKTHKPQLVSELWPSLAEIGGFESIDSAVNGEYTHALTGEALNRKLFLFKRDQYVRLDIDTLEIDEGYPKDIKEGWPGVTFDRIDAALNVHDSIYFFRGNQYIRYDLATNQVDPIYPQLTRQRWAGVTFDRIDAAIYWGGGKAYFFRGDEHIRYSMIEYHTDPGYPKFIVGSYVEDWKFFD
jgi:hypothetical protein